MLPGSVLSAPDAISVVAAGAVAAGSFAAPAAVPSRATIYSPASGWADMDYSLRWHMYPWPCVVPIHTLCGMD